MPLDLLDLTCPLFSSYDGSFLEFLTAWLGDREATLHGRNASSLWTVRRGRRTTPSEVDCDGGVPAAQNLWWTLVRRRLAGGLQALRGCLVGAAVFGRPTVVDPAIADRAAARAAARSQFADRPPVGHRQLVGRSLAHPSEILPAAPTRRGRCHALRPAPCSSVVQG